MGQTDTTAVAPHDPADKGRSEGGAAQATTVETRPGRRQPGRSGLFAPYKPEQGKWTRIGTFLGAGALIVWGAFFIKNRLTGYEDIGEWWGLMITPGIPIAFAVIMGAAAWWVSFAYRPAGDFFIATEGEMKKVNWSNRREIVGSTKVVILFTLLLAVFLFVVDFVFVTFFSGIGVLKR